MPIYKFKCVACKKEFTIQASAEEIVKNPTPPCGYCGSKEVKRIFSGVSVITSKKS